MTSPIARGTRLPLTPDGRFPLELAGRAGYTIDLEPGGAVKQYSWNPEVEIVGGGRPNMAADYDVQVAWTNVTKPENNPPLVYWACQYGHGEMTYFLPFKTTPINDPTIEGWQLPQRGMRLRIPGREIRFYFWVPPVAPPPEPVVIGGAPCTIQISVQPCCGLEPEQLPVTDMLYANSAYEFGGRPSQLPLGATEMRACDPSTGLPFASGSAFVQFLDASGTNVPFGPTDITLFDEWKPIPIFAAYWWPVDSGESVGQATQVSFR